MRPQTALARLLCGLVTVLLTTGTMAQDTASYPVPLKDCRFANGIDMPADECEVLRRVHREELAKAQASRAALDLAIRQADAEQQAERNIQAERAKSAEASRAADQARQRARLQAVQAELAAEERAEEARDRKAVAAMKTRCGTDYKAPRIGMPIERAQQCVAPSMQVTGYIHRADGEITTYTTNNGTFFHVMKGVVVAWGR